MVVGYGAEGREDRGYADRAGGLRGFEPSPVRVTGVLFMLLVSYFVGAVVFLLSYGISSSWRISVIPALIAVVVCLGLGRWRMARRVKRGRGTRGSG